MDTTIRNLDPDSFRALKAHAGLTGRTIGSVLNEAIRAFLARGVPSSGRRSLGELRPLDYPEGCESLSEDIDTVVYGIGS